MAFICHGKFKGLIWVYNNSEGLARGAKNVLNIVGRKYFVVEPLIILVVNFTFVFPCIVTLYYIKNQLDAALAVLFISHCKILQ